MTTLVHANIQGSQFNRVRRKIAATIAMAQSISGHATSDLRAHASWIDRTGLARASLNATVRVQFLGDRTLIILRLAHGMEYGIWLELANAGKYAIVGPTTLFYRNLMRQYIRRIWDTP